MKIDKLADAMDCMDMEDLYEKAIRNVLEGWDKLGNQRMLMICELCDEYRDNLHEMLDNAEELL